MQKNWPILPGKISERKGRFISGRKTPTPEKGPERDPICADNHLDNAPLSAATSRPLPFFWLCSEAQMFGI